MAPNEQSELDALMAQLADGDRSVFKKVFNCLWPIVRRLCSGVLRSPADAEDGAQLAMIKIMERAHTVRLRPVDRWRKKHVERWYSGLPEFLKRLPRRLWPEERPLTWDELTTEMNAKMQFPGWTNAWTMPIKTRVDMLTTGIRTPIGIKVFGTSLEEIEKIGKTLGRQGDLTPHCAALTSSGCQPQ